MAGGLLQLGVYFYFRASPIHTPSLGAFLRPGAAVTRPGGTGDAGVVLPGKFGCFPAALLFLAWCAWLRARG